MFDTTRGHNFIAGEWVDGAGVDLVSISPVDQQPTWQGTAASVDQARAAVDAAREAFASWRSTTRQQRDAIVERFADLVTEHRDEFAALISTEVGKTRADAAGEVSAIIGKAATSIAAREDRTGSTARELPAGELHVTHRPLGPAIVLGPFNFPGHLPNGHITPALLAGNTVVFKPSEQAPATAQRMVELWEEAGVPGGVINLVQGGSDIAQTLIDHDDTASVLFTGGVHAGRAIHRQLAGRPDVLLALELGGNNPIIAWDVDDIDAAAALIVRSAFLSSGQRCTCARRLIVADDASGSDLVDAVVDLTRQLVVGRPGGEQAPFMGPVVSTRAAAHVLAAQDALIEGGGVPLQRAEELDLGPAYVSPGVIDVTGVNDRPDEEIFGPVLQVIRVTDLDAAAAEANDTQFGLAAAVVTADDEVWQTLEPRLDAGIVNRNVMTVGASGLAPFGGTGASGNHRPAGYRAADYVAHPVASLIQDDLSGVAPIAEV